MGCLEMYNSEHKGAPMSPRISFSNDFVESSHSQKHLGGGSSSSSRQREAPISTDFEFSVSNNSLQLTADELFFKGRILPLKNNQFQKPPPATTTLRDELLAGDDEDQNGFSLKPPLKGRWRGFLGLRKSHIGSKKPDSSNTHRSYNEPGNMFSFPLQDPNLSRAPQGMIREEGASNAADMEMKL